jgi:hypothetical protein
MILPADDDHLSCDRRAGHHDFSHRISGKQLIRRSCLDYKDLAILIYEIDFPIGCNR